MKIQNALVSNIFDRSQRYFAHVTTVTLSWRVKNIVVIGRVYFTLECFEFSSNFEFDRNMLSGTGAWNDILQPGGECSESWSKWPLTFSSNSATKHKMNQADSKEIISKSIWIAYSLESSKYFGKQFDRAFMEEPIVLDSPRPSDTYMFQLTLELTLYLNQCWLHVP